MRESSAHARRYRCRWLGGDVVRIVGAAVPGEHFFFLRRVPLHGSVGGIAFACSASHCSDMTRRWREPDSNPRSPRKTPGVFAGVGSRVRTDYFSLEGKSAEVTGGGLDHLGCVSAPNRDPTRKGDNTPVEQLIRLRFSALALATPAHDTAMQIHRACRVGQ